MRASFLTRPALLAAAAATLAVVAVRQPAAAAPGDLDPSFGIGVRATIHVQPGDPEFGFGGALAPDGKVLIAATSTRPAAAPAWRA